MEDEDRAFFSNECNVKEIFQLGLQALGNRQSIQGAGFYASDSSNKRSCSKDADNTSQASSKTHKLVIDSAAFTQNVTKKKSKGKGRQCWVTPQYSLDDQMVEDNGSLISPTSKICWLDNFQFILHLVEFHSEMDLGLLDYIFVIQLTFDSSCTTIECSTIYFFHALLTIQLFHFDLLKSCLYMYLSFIHCCLVNVLKTQCFIKLLQDVICPAYTIIRVDFNLFNL
jgi:hypothetical protein